MPDSNTHHNPIGQDYFATTHWSVVVKAGQVDSTRAQQALTQLCLTYWYPLYSYVRRKGYTRHDAEDLTQEFFARLLEKNAVSYARQERGKFRSFLLASMNHFLADEWHRAHAQKRGLDKVVPLDAEMAENRFFLEPADADTPEKAFHRNWATTLLETVYCRLRAEHETAGKSELFTALKFCLTGDSSSMPYTQLAEKLGMSESAVKVTVHRLRERYRKLLREEIANTVEGASEVEEELRFLLQALAR